MAKSPEVRSFEQILSEALSTYESKHGANDNNIGSAKLSFLESAAQLVYRTTGDTFQILRDRSVDRAKGEALKDIAREENVPLLAATPATGPVKIIDTSFEKIATKIYAGSISQNLPNIGKLFIEVSDASPFPATGSLYIGRGLNTVEGPIAYTSVVQIGGYWRINLASPLTKYHNISESVILAQGGTRTVSAGTVISAPAVGASEDILFSLTENVTLLDGENEIKNVKVVSQKTGAKNNVPKGAITTFPSEPFSGASVINEVRFDTARNTERDEELRERIKRARLSKGLGTPLAIKNATRGAKAPDEAATVTSNEMVTGDVDRTVLYIDNGEAYEEKSQGVGLERIVDSALGGEYTFQLSTGGRQTQLAKAFIETSLSSPFAISAGDVLAVLIGGTAYEHTFVSGDFVSDGAATAFEVVASINNNSSLAFEATTSENGEKVVLSAKEEDNEYIQITSPSNIIADDAGSIMGFPINEIETLRLYKDNKPLNKNGRSAVIRTENQIDWSNAIASGDTLKIAIDGTPQITYTFTDADFIAEGSHTTVSSTNIITSWVNVINSKVTGITAEVDGTQIKITSNLGTKNRASIVIDPTSTLVTKGMFTTNQGLNASGLEADFQVSRNTAQVKLFTPLVKGQKLTAGSDFTNGNVESSPILGGTLSFPGDANIWVVMDDPTSQVINTGLIAGTLLDVSKQPNNTIRLFSNTSNVFTNVQVGDYAVIWSEELSVTNRGEFVVTAKTNDYLEFRVTALEYALATVESLVSYSEGIVILRSEKVPQKFTVTSGVKNINTVAEEIASQFTMGSVLVDNDEILIFVTNTKTENGGVHIVTFDSDGKNLNFEENVSDFSRQSQIASYDSQNREGTFPLFIHGKVDSENNAYPPAAYIETINIDTDITSQDPNNLFSILSPYSTINDVLGEDETAQIKTQSSTTLNFTKNPLIKRLRDEDRYAILSPLNFGHNDEIVAVLDEDASNKSFKLPMSRTATTNTTFPLSANTFNVYDTDNGPTASIEDSFGSLYDFSNYKVLMQAKNYLDPDGDENSILFKSNVWGKGGEKYKVGYTYPTAANADVLSTVTVRDEVDIKISLKSGNSITTAIDGTTEWNVSITPNTPVAGVDQVTYTHSGTGTAPGLGSLAGGEYVNIRSNSGFNPNNIGVFKVSDEIGFLPTATSFTVTRPNGAAVAENDIPTLVAASMSFYQSDVTTALEIKDYIDANLSDYITATLLDDNGNSGTGTITKSTYEETNFTNSEVYLLDGVNWILSNDLSSSPQFTFKKNLQLVSGGGYNFNDGEVLKLVPTTFSQLAEFLNTLSVTGYSTLGSISLTNRDNALELGTQILGSSGAVQIIGGSGNKVTTPVINQSIEIDNSYMKTSVGSAAVAGINSDSWVKLEASDSQNKITNFSNVNRVTIRPNVPTTNKTTLEITNSQDDERHFGVPRRFVRERGRTFKVEFQGNLVCISHDGIGTSPFFTKEVELNDTAGGTISVKRETNSSLATYVLESGNGTFKALENGDTLTVTGLANSENNGTFKVIFSSSNGKTVTVRNPNAINSLPNVTITITNNVNIGLDTFNVNGTNLVEGTDFNAGATDEITAQNLAAAIAVIVGVTAVADGNVITVTSDDQGVNIPISYTDSGSGIAATVSDSQLTGETFVDANLTGNAKVREGDTVVVGSPFSILNQGRHRVIRTYGDSFYIENSKAVEEIVTIADNLISFGGNGTTEYDVVNSNGHMRIQWNGNGTEPDFGTLSMGDILYIGTDFNAANQGDFSILKSRSAQAQITRITTVAATEMTTGDYFLMNAAGDAPEYYFWYNINGNGGDPAIVGKTGVEIALTAVDSAEDVATKTNNAVDALVTFISGVQSNIVTATTVGKNFTTAASDGNIGGNFQIETLRLGNVTYIDLMNPGFATESAITISDIFEAHSPAMKFYEYEATVANDILNISSDYFGELNIGTWTIEKVVDRNTVVLTGNMVTLEETPILDNEEAIFVEEGVKYTGYKYIHTMGIDPGNDSLMNLIFNSQDQVEKINNVGVVFINTINKLNFITSIKNGLDSYRYDTGLLAETNRIVYGDPRDNITYPGVSAAGAEIFIKPPLVKKIQVSVDIRVKTGIPFSSIAEQARNAISALVNSNDIGQPIAISDIVGVVRTIPGVLSVAISSPQYDANNDVISVQPSEKTLILDDTNDIIVSEID
jgi:hypothetical protein